MTEQQYIDALKEIYILAAGRKGRRERKTRGICRAMLGNRACDLIDADLAIAAARSSQAETAAK